MNKAAAFFIALASVAGLIVILAVFANDYAMAPAIVPTHFGVSGAPNAWGPRSTFIIFPAIATIFAGASIALWVFGMPSQPGRPEPPPVVSLLVMLVLAESTWMLVFAEIGSFDVALGRAGGLGSGFYAGIAAVLITAAVLVIFTVLAVRRTNS